MNELLIRFDEDLKTSRNMATNSRKAYGRDMTVFFRQVEKKGITRISDVTNTEIIGYLLEMKNEGKSASTVNRKLASLRAFFRFLVKEGIVDRNPTEGLKSPRIESKKPEYLTVDQVEQFLSIPGTTPKEIRDRAILEVLYASGMRVSEIAGANLADTNLRIGFIMSDGAHGKARIVPLGRPARIALEAYVYDARSKLIRDQREDQAALFVNYNGERLTRQGIWKILKVYAKAAGIEGSLTPQILRNSFAVHMLQNGADLRTLQELLGHEDIAATKLYLSVAKKKIKDVYDKTHPRA